MFSAIQEREPDGGVGGMDSRGRSRSRSRSPSRAPGTPSRYGDEMQGVADVGGNLGLTALRRALMPTLLCAAAGTGDADAILAMVTDGAVLRTAIDYDGRTPLHLAASEGRDAVLSYLLQPEHGVHLSALDRNENTPLANACKFRHRRAIALLVEAGATLALREQRLAGILCTLVKSRDIAGLECYIAGCADVCVADHSETTPLHIAAAQGDITATTMLLAAGASCGAVDRWGRTPYHEATSPSDPEGGLQPNEGHASVAALLRRHTDDAVAAAMSSPRLRASPMHSPMSEEVMLEESSKGS